MLIEYLIRPFFCASVVFVGILAIHVCYCLNYPELPLKGNFDETKYKIYFADSGLLVAMLDEEAQEDLRANRNLGVYKGALYENIVGEALVKILYFIDGKHNF